ncbi:hypothetical protein [Ferrovibrio sp.]|uniref:hypothetical protein n=1 Tax=Ferrovibrio sp. TaxID=1917215 RepID=UPI0026117187|nr:hypothetical protein [Ferrovibrio sp.]
MPYKPENDPFKEEYIPPPPQSETKPRRPQIAWRRGAMMWADGEEVPAICATLGIDEARFWRHVGQSQRFRFHIEQASARRRLQARFRLEHLGRDALLRAVQQIEKYDAETLRWLGAQAGLESGMRAEAAPSSGRPDAPEPDLGERLRRAAAPPPNMAFRKRIAAERAKMDAEVARIKAEVARRQARQAAADSAAKQNQGLSEAKPAQNDATPMQAAAPSPSPMPSPSTSPRSTPQDWQPPPRPPRPPAPPPPRSRAELLGTIIDLPGPDMDRIRYARDPDPDEEMETS